MKKAKEMVVEIEAEIDQLEKSKHRTYISCLASLSTKEPVSKLPSHYSEFLEEQPSLDRFLQELPSLDPEFHE